jgi:uncharacterized protein (TIGR00251 family)
MNITTTPTGITFAVRATPRAKKNKLGGVAGDALKVYVTPPPEDGRANDAVIEVIADALGIKRRQVEIISGATNRNKVVRVTGVTAAAVQSKIGC